MSQCTLKRLDSNVYNYSSGSEDNSRIFSLLDTVGLVSAGFLTWDFQLISATTTLHLSNIEESDFTVRFSLASSKTFHF